MVRSGRLILQGVSGRVYATFKRAQRVLPVTGEQDPDRPLSCTYPFVHGPRQLRWRNTTTGLGRTKGRCQIREGDLVCRVEEEMKSRTGRNSGSRMETFQFELVCGYGIFHKHQEMSHCGLRFHIRVCHCLLLLIINNIYMPSCPIPYQQREQLKHCSRLIYSPSLAGGP